MIKILGVGALTLGLLGCTEKIEEAKTAAAQAQALAKAATEAAEAAGRAAEQAAEAAEEGAAEGAEGAEAAGKAADGAAQDLGSAMKQMEAAMKGVTAAGGNVDPVGFRDLKKLLPTEVDGFTLDDSGGEKTKAMGVNISQAHAKFKNSDGGRLDLRIQDFGSMKSFMGMAAVGWAMVDIDKESSKGYERTGTEDGHRFHEKFTKRGERSEIQFFVAERFLVAVKGRKVKMETVKKALKEVDMDELEDLKDFGVKKK